MHKFCLSGLFDVVQIRHPHKNTVKFCQTSAFGMYLGEMASRIIFLYIEAANMGLGHERV